MQEETFKTVLGEFIRNDKDFLSFEVRGSLVATLASQFEEYNPEYLVDYFSKFDNSKSQQPQRRPVNKDRLESLIENNEGKQAKKGSIELDNGDVVYLGLSSQTITVKKRDQHNVLKGSFSFSPELIKAEAEDVFQSASTDYKKYDFSFDTKTGRESIKLLDKFGEVFTEISANKRDDSFSVKFYEGGKNKKRVCHEFSYQKDKEAVSKHYDYKSKIKGITTTTYYPDAVSVHEGETVISNVVQQIDFSDLKGNAQTRRYVDASKELYRFKATNNGYARIGLPKPKKEKALSKNKKVKPPRTAKEVKAVFLGYDFNDFDNPIEIKPQDRKYVFGHDDMTHISFARKNILNLSSILFPRKKYKKKEVKEFLFSSNKRIQSPQHLDDKIIKKELFISFVPFFPDISHDSISTHVHHNYYSQDGDTVYTLKDIGFIKNNDRRGNVRHPVTISEGSFSLRKKSGFFVNFDVNKPREKEQTILLESGEFCFQTFVEGKLSQEIHVNKKNQLIYIAQQQEDGWEVMFGTRSSKFDEKLEEIKDFSSQASQRWESHGIEVAKEHASEDYMKMLQDINSDCIQGIQEEMLGSKEERSSADAGLPYLEVLLKAVKHRSYVGSSAFQVSTLLDHMSSK